MDHQIEDFVIVYVTELLEDVEEKKVDFDSPVNY